MALSFSPGWIPLLLVLCLDNIATVSSQTSVPPLQWIELTSLLKGDQPPALKDASIGYDQTSNTLILFGGEQNNVPQSNTYLLNLVNFTWRAPSPPSNLPAPLLRSPSPRSAAIFGTDSAASYRRAFVVIGGKGTNDDALSDVWAFDFGSEIWAEMQLSPGGPSPRWGASGGIDLRTPTTQDPRLASPNNTFYLSGGSNASQAHPLSDTWKLSITGTLSSNNPSALFGSWEKVSGLKDLPRKDGQAGCVIGSTIIAYGGCNSTSIDGSQSCAQQDGYVIDTNSPSSFPCQTCPTPRLGASVIPNLNTASDSFSSQAFLLQGIFDDTTWDDGSNSKKGEIAVLSYRTGSWSRILPAGDPGSSNTVRYPISRQGAAVYSFNSGLVGSSTDKYTDTLMYGGQDADGNYLHDMWLLRAYDGLVSSSDAHWSGYGNGKLQSGIDANGAGVTNEFLSHCAIRIPLPTQTPTSPSFPSPSTTSSTPESRFSSRYITSTSHKALSAVSVLLLFPAVLCYRIAFSDRASHSHQPSFFIFLFFTVASYAVAIGGLVLAFTSITSASSLSKRSNPAGSTLKTAHGRAALVLFVIVYAVTPLLVGLSRCWSSIQSRRKRVKEISPTPIEKSTLDVPRSRNSVSSYDHPPSRSLGPSSVVTHSGHPETRLSSDQASTLSDPSPAARSSFAVLNRGNRGRRGSHSGWLSARAAELSSDGHTGHVRSLSDVDWLARRRSLNAVGELDYAITIAQRANETSTPGTMDQLMTSNGMKHLTPPPSLRLSDIIIRLLFHLSLLGLCGVTLAALWIHGPKSAFGAFLAVAVASYLLLFYHAWRSEPANSFMYSLISRLRQISNPQPNHDQRQPFTPAETEGQYPFPTSTEDHRSPYSWHQPAYHAATSTGHESTNYHDEAEDENEDDDVRQRIMEEEMNRRDVSIVTVPKRKLWIANPEPQH